jgi:hypothetical protein
VAAKARLAELETCIGVVKTFLLVPNEIVNLERRNTIMKTLKAETQTSVRRGYEPNTSGRSMRTSQSNAPESLVQNDIAKLAYALWQQRGCPYGTPEFDWTEAERKLRQSS